MPSFMDPINADQRALREMGYGGKFGEDQAINYKKGFTDDQWAKYKPLKQKYQTMEQGPGVRPTTVASQNDYQKGALYDMGKAPAPVDPRVSQRFDQAGASYDPNSRQQFMNPFIDEVINRNATDINRAYNVNRNNINEDFAAAGGFGSSAQGTERALTNEAEGRQIGDMSAQLRKGGYDSAVGNAMSLYGTDINKNLAVGQGIQGLDAYGRGVTRQGYADKLAAGDRVQLQNQSVLDGYFRERAGEAGHPYQQVDFLKGVLGAYPTGVTSSQTGPGVSSTDAMLGGANIASGLADRLGGQFGFGKQWTNPDTGSVIY